MSELPDGFYLLGERSVLCDGDDGREVCEHVNIPERCPECKAYAVSEHFNLLTPAQLERLAILSEECGEVVQVIGKILRHGFDSASPVEVNATRNRGLLEYEIGHVYHAIQRMLDAGDIQHGNVAFHQETKAERIGRYLHHQGEENGE